MNITVFEIIISTYLYFLMKVWGLVRKEKESRHCELIQFQSKSRAVWTLNSIKEKWKTNRTSFPAKTSIRWWTGARKSVLNKHNGWRNLSRISQLYLMIRLVHSSPSLSLLSYVHQRLPLSETLKFRTRVNQFFPDTVKGRGHQNQKILLIFCGNLRTLANC